MTGIENYKTGTKNNWRNMCWNEIARRVPDKKNAKVLYLAAEQDLDRRTALRKGFNANNMIAVDKRISVVSELRKMSKVAIHSGLAEVALVYPECEVIHADLCCGFGKSVADLLMGTVYKKSKVNRVVLINMQRGRETKEEYTFLEKEKKHMARFGLPDDTHRARILFFSIVRSYIKAAFETMEKNKQSPVTVSELWNESVNILKWLDLTLLPFFRSYESASKKGLYFDTIIFSIPSDLPQIKELDKAVFDTEYGNEILNAKNKLRAAKAVQTMRSNGTLAPSNNF